MRYVAGSALVVCLLQVTYMAMSERLSGWQQASSEPPEVIGCNLPSYRVPLSLVEGEVAIPKGLLATIEKGHWRTVESGLDPSCLEEGGACKMGKEVCTSSEAVPHSQLVSLAAKLYAGESVVVNAGEMGSSACPGRPKELVMIAGVTQSPPLVHPSYNCSNHARGVRLIIGPNGFEKKCTCHGNYAGDSCERCATGFREYPRCGTLPYEPKVHKRERGPNDRCPQDLYRWKCNTEGYSQALLQPKSTHQPLSIVECHVGAKPYGCEIESKTTPIKSLVTMISGFEIGLQIMLFFESVRVFAPDVPCVIGYNQANSTLHSSLSQLLNQGANIELMPINKTQTTWYNEKALLMKRVLEKYENTMWVDGDAFLVAPLAEMPDSPLATFGTAVHIPQGWGFGKLPMDFGLTNTGVLFAARGTKHIDAWLDSINRFDQTKHRKELFRGARPMFLDQQPMDFSLINEKGGFILDPAWNVAWWVDEGRVQKSIGASSFYSGAAYQRFESRTLKLSPDNSSILFHGAPAQIIHSHFVATEKHNKRTNQDFNTLIFDLVQSAAPGTLLHKFAPRLRRYGTHVAKPSPESVRPPSDEFAITLKQWD